MTKPQIVITNTTEDPPRRLSARDLCGSGNHPWAWAILARNGREVQVCAICGRRR